MTFGPPCIDLIISSWHNASFALQDSHATSSLGASWVTRIFKNHAMFAQITEHNIGTRLHIHYYIKLYLRKLENQNGSRFHPTGLRSSRSPAFRDTICIENIIMIQCLFNSCKAN